MDIGAFKAELEAAFVGVCKKQGFSEFFYCASGSIWPILWVNDEREVRSGDYFPFHI